MFPPGRARLAIKPFPTGSLSRVITMGIVEVAALAARVAPKPPETMMSTLRRPAPLGSLQRHAAPGSILSYDLICPRQYVR